MEELGGARVDRDEASEVVPREEKGVTGLTSRTKGEEYGDDCGIFRNSKDDEAQKIDCHDHHRESDPHYNHEGGYRRCDEGMIGRIGLQGDDEDVSARGAHNNGNDWQKPSRRHLF